MLCSHSNEGAARPIWRVPGYVERRPSTRLCWSTVSSALNLTLTSDPTLPSATGKYRHWWFLRRRATVPTETPRWDLNHNHTLQRQAYSTRCHLVKKVTDANFPSLGHWACRRLYHSLWRMGMWRQTYGCLPSHRSQALLLAGIHFSVALRAGGWVGLSGWLHTKTAYSRTVTHLSANRDRRTVTSSM